MIQIIVDTINLSGSIDCIGEGGQRFGAHGGGKILAARSSHPNLQPNPDLPDDTRLWAALQNISGGTWGGCVYDVDLILESIGELMDKSNSKLSDSK
jgi:hypothetical protein